MANIFDAKPNPTGTPSTIIAVDELNALRETAALLNGYMDMAERLADALHSARPDHPLLRDEMWVERRQQRWEADPNERGTSPERIDPEFTEEEAAAHTARLDAEAGGRREMGGVFADGEDAPQRVTADDDERHPYDPNNDPAV